MNAATTDRSGRRNRHTPYDADGVKLEDGPGIPWHDECQECYEKTANVVEDLSLGTIRHCSKGGVHVVTAQSEN